jgi:hypothetical protein
MAAVAPCPPTILQFFNNAGQFNIGGSVLTQVGGVNYPTYQDAAGTIPLPNPIPLNSRGEISNASGVSCQLFLAQGVAYTFTLFDASGNQLNQATYTVAVTMTDEIWADARYGADSTGVSDSAAAFTAAGSVYAREQVNIPAGTFKLNSAPTPTATALVWSFQPGATLTGAGAGSTGWGAGPLLQDCQSITTSTDIATRYVRRTTSHTGGNAGFVNATLMAESFIGSGVTDIEWTILGVLHNSATEGQNVAGYFQGNKLAGAGPTWAGVVEAHDRSGISNPTTSLLGLEVDVFADGTDINSQRIGVDIVGGVGVSIGPTIYAGLRIGPQNGAANNCNYTNEVYLYGVATRGINIALAANSSIGIDVSSSTLSYAALRIGSSQYVGFDSSDVHTLGYNSGTGLGYSVSGVLQSRLNDDGSIQYGGAAHAIVLKSSFSTASAAAVLTANKPGSTTAVSTWQEIDIDGTAYVYPLWLKA